MCSSVPPTPYLALLRIPPPPTSTLFPYTTLFRSPLITITITVNRTVFILEIVKNKAIMENENGTTPQYNSNIVERSEEHTSELQSRGHLVCRLLLEKKKTVKGGNTDYIQKQSTVI